MNLPINRSIPRRIGCSLVAQGLVTTRTGTILGSAGPVMTDQLRPGQIGNALEVACHTVVRRSTHRVVVVHPFAGCPVCSTRRDIDRRRVATGAIRVGRSADDRGRDMVGYLGDCTKQSLTGIRAVVTTVAAPGYGRMLHAVLRHATH